MLSVTLSSLKDLAKKTTGLSDFGDERFFSQPVEFMVNTINKNPSLSVLGRLSIKTEVVSALVNRLFLMETLKKDKSILETKFLPPVIIVGLPRTGTTLV